MSLLAKRINLVQKYLLFLMAFFFPIYTQIVPYLLGGFGFLSILSISIGQSRARLSLEGIMMISLFFLHALGMLYTENIDRGWFDLEVKLSLVVIPLTMIGFRFLSIKTYERVLSVFVLGVLINGLFCLLNAFYNYYFTQPPIGKYAYYFFFSGHFSALLHPNYFSLYAVFAIVILSYLAWPRLNNRLTFKVFIMLFSAAYLSLTIVLSGSKIGIIMWLIVASVLFVMTTIYTRKKWIPIVWFLTLFAILSGVVLIAPTAKERLISVTRVLESKNAHSSGESTALRTFVYRSSWNILRHQPWYGQGTGDFQSALDLEYEKNGYSSALDRHLNAHNEYFQVAIALGIPGIILLITLYIFMLVKAIRSLDWPYLGFIVLFMVICLTESALNVQAGVVFFSFFTCVFARRSSMTLSANSL